MPSSARPTAAGNRDSFGKRLRAIRGARVMTQGKLANAAGLSLQTIKNIEHGRTKLNSSVAQSLADALHCQVKNFFEDVGAPIPPDRRKRRT